VQVWAPIVGVPTPLDNITHVGPSNIRVLGYVTVGISQSAEQAQVHRVNLIGGLIGGSIIFLCFPLAFALVHRLFSPIRHLVAAANKISAGELDTQVEIHRTDVIGNLARSFNAMTKTVKEHRDKLEIKVQQRTSH